MRLLVVLPCIGHLFPLSVDHSAGKGLEIRRDDQKKAYDTRRHGPGWYSSQLQVMTCAGGLASVKSLVLRSRTTVSGALATQSGVI